MVPPPPPPSPASSLSCLHLLLPLPPASRATLMHALPAPPLPHALLPSACPFSSTWPWMTLCGSASAALRPCRCLVVLMPVTLPPPVSLLLRCLLLLPAPPLPPLQLFLHSTWPSLTSSDRRSPGAPRRARPTTHDAPPTAPTPPHTPTPSASSASSSAAAAAAAASFPLRLFPPASASSFSTWPSMTSSDRRSLVAAPVLPPTTRLLRPPPHHPPPPPPEFAPLGASGVGWYWHRRGRSGIRGICGICSHRGTRPPDLRWQIARPRSRGTRNAGAPHHHHLLLLHHHLLHFHHPSERRSARFYAHAPAAAFCCNTCRRRRDLHRVCAQRHRAANRIATAPPTPAAPANPQTLFLDPSPLRQRTHWAAARSCRLPHFC